MHGRRPQLELAARVAMAIALALCPAYVIRFHSGIPTTLLEVALVVAIAIGLVAFWDRLPWRNQYTLPALVVLAGATLGVLASPDHRAALGIWKAYFVEPALAAVVIAAMVRRWEDARLLLAGLGVAGAVSALINLADDARSVLTHHFSVVHPPVVIYQTPNAIPLFLVPLMAFAAPLVLHAPRRIERVVAAAFLALTALAVLLSYSRAGLITVAVLGVFFILFTRLRLQLLGALAVLLVVALVALRSLRRRFEIELDPSNPDNTIRLRLALWKSALNLLRHQPIFGGGLSGFQRSVVPYRDPSYRENLIYPHNIVLNFWTETGLIGLVGFIWLCVSVVRTAILGLSREPWIRALSLGALGLIVAFGVHGIADVPYFKNDQSLAFWALLGIQLGALRSCEIDSQPRPGPTTSLEPSSAS